MPNPLNITGSRFGRLMAVAATEKRSGGKIVWHCKCDCGTDCFAAINHLRDGRRVSCGCAKIAGNQIKKKPPSHGHYCDNKPSPTYSSWSSMRSRCLNPKVPDFHRYGGRGIKICTRWDVFSNFLTDMGERPVGTTLDRKNVNGNYEPSNCRWATQEVQVRNTRINRYMTAFGRSQILADWSREFGIPNKTITDRLLSGLTLEAALVKRNTRSARTL